MVENEAPDGGGLAYGSLTGVGGGSGGEVINTTVAKNKALHGGGVYLNENSGPLFINCILSGNEAQNNGADYYHSQSNGTLLSTVDGPGDFFVDADHGDFRLKEGSAPVDGGYPDTAGLHLPAVDLDGNPRISGAKIDMGAYEFKSSSAVRFASASGLGSTGFAREGKNLRISWPAGIEAAGPLRVRDSRGRVVLEAMRVQVSAGGATLVPAATLLSGAYLVDLAFLRDGRLGNLAATVTFP